MRYIVMMSARYIKRYNSETFNRSDNYGTAFCQVRFVSEFVFVFADNVEYSRIVGCGCDTKRL